VSSRFLIFLAAGLAVVGALIFTLLTATRGAHLQLQGKILKVRVLPLSGTAACLVVVDFRAENPSDVPFVGSSVALRLTTASGETVDGTIMSKPDVETVFQAYRLLGPKYNDVFSLQDRIPPHRSVDRMAGARFELTEAAINTRKSLLLRLEDVDGAVSELTEAK
jgi:hypothetical protein